MDLIKIKKVKEDIKMKFNKLISFVLVCVMLISAFAINTFAADGEDTAPAKIVSENVYYGDTLKLMFAVAADDGVDYELVVIDADEKKVPVSPYLIDGQQEVAKGGLVYVVNVGVPAQNIADEVTVQVVVDGEVVDEKVYSVLEYLYTRLYVNTDATATQIAKYEALIAFADAADIAVNKTAASDSVANYKFVNAIGATVENSDSNGIYKKGSEITLTTDLVAGDGELLVWNVTDLDSGSSKQLDDNNGSLTMTVDGNVKVEPAVVESSDLVETDLNLVFDSSKANRVSFSGTQQVWAANGITFTNNKASSSNAVADYAAPVRLYQGSEIVVECEGMTKIVINSPSGDYYTALKSSLSSVSGATVTASGTSVTIEFAEAVDSFTFTCSGGQVRFNSLTVTALRYQ